MANSAAQVASLKLKLIDEFSGVSKKFAAEMDRVDKASGESAKSMKAVTKSLASMRDGFSIAAVKIGAFTLAAAAGAYAVKKLADGAIGIFKPFVEAGALVEGFRVRLDAMYGSASEGAEVFDFIVEKASKIPATLDEVVAAGISLKSFGANVKETITPVADLAAFMGLNMVEAASAFGRAFAGGAGAADIFREKGVLELLKTKSGIDDLTKLSLPEFRRVMIETFTEAGGGIAGMADALSKTWAGKIANIEDVMFGFKKLVADEIFPKVKAAISSVLDKLNELSDNGKLKEWAKSTGELLGKMFDAMLLAAPYVVRAFGTVIKVGTAFAKVSAAAALAWNSVRLANAGMQQVTSFGLNKGAANDIEKLLAKEKELSALVVSLTEFQDGFSSAVEKSAEEVKRLATELRKAAAEAGDDGSEKAADEMKRIALTKKKAAEEAARAARDAATAAEKATKAEEKRLKAEAATAAKVAKDLQEKADAYQEYYARIGAFRAAMKAGEKAAARDALEHDKAILESTISSIGSQYSQLVARQRQAVDEMNKNWDLYTSKIRSVGNDLRDLQDRMFNTKLNQKDRFGGDKYDEDEKTLLRLIRFEEMYKKAMEATGDEQRKLLVEAIKYRETINGEVTGSAIRSLSKQGYDTDSFSRTDAFTLQKDLEALQANLESLLKQTEQGLITERQAQYEKDQAATKALQSQIDGSIAQMNILKAQLQEFRLALAGSEGERELIVITSKADEAIATTAKKLRESFPASGVKSKLDIDIDPATRALDEVKRSIEEIKRLLEETGSIFGVSGTGRSSMPALQSRAQASATQNMNVEYGDARARRAQSVTINVTTTGKTAAEIDADLAALWTRKSSKLRQAVAA